MEGREVPWSDVGLSRLGRAHWNACVPNGSGGLDKVYREQWVLCFNHAVRFAGNQKTPLGTYHILNRFYRPIIPQLEPPRPELRYTFPLFLVKHERLHGLTLGQLNYAVSEAVKNAGDVSAQWISHAEATNGYVRLSVNPLGLYSTWVKSAHLADLVKDQAESGMWTRVLPTATQVVAFNEKLLSKGTLKFNPLPAVSKSSLLQWPGQNLRYYPRRTTEAVMGASANKVFGRLVSSDGIAPSRPVQRWVVYFETSDIAVALRPNSEQWLHLIAHQFDHSGDRFSNMIFGTKECNTAMIRAEATIRQLLFSGRTYAVEVETEIRRNLTNISMVDTSNSTAVVSWLNPQYHEPQVKRYPHWLAPELKYTITSYRPDQGTCVKDPHTTTFHPFSRQRPFRFEYQLDKILLEMYLATFEIPIETDPNQVFKEILADRNPAPLTEFFEWGAEYESDGGESEWSPDDPQDADVPYPDLTPPEAEEELHELQAGNKGSLLEQSKPIKKSPREQRKDSGSKAKQPRKDATGTNATGKQVSFTAATVFEVAFFIHFLTFATHLTSGVETKKYLHQP
ncbi:hypothetical protein FRC10_000249 [Ceratobasidium sp. 414]|nr:hypothetical protein FRC10_000249 [Ceratobasidium sp. 414]